MHTTTSALLICAMLAAGIGAADAKRLGGGKTSGIAKAEPSAPKAAPAAAPPATAAPPAAAAKPPSNTGKVVAAAAIGAGAGVVAGAALAARAPATAATPTPGAAPDTRSVSPSIAASEARLRKLDEEAARDKTEKAPPVKTAAERRREKQEADAKAAQERKAEAQRAQLAREMSCQIKPVMTDAEIANCKTVWR